MRHREAIRHLSDRLSGELDTARRTRLEEHVASCDECGAWSETYDFLAGALQADEAGHPAAEQLARLAVDAEGLTEPERQRLGAHLADCARCRSELELSRAALAEARRPAEAVPFRLPVTGPAARRLALAASLILALAVTLVLTRPETAAPERAATAGAARTVEPGAVTGPLLAGEAARPLTGGLPAGPRLIEAPRRINANEPIIESGGAVTLRAGELVVLGDGFSIGSSATLGVEIAPRRVDDGDSENRS